MIKLVKPENFNDVLATLKGSERLALDTETTGLEPYHGDKLFSVIVADANDEYYFNFNIGGLRKSDYLPPLEQLLNSIKYLFFINYDYDAAILANDNVVLSRPTIIDGGVAARLEYSLHRPLGSKAENQFFSLGYLAKYYLGKEKDSSVEDYIKENDLYGTDRHGKKKPLYDKVPLEIMAKYGASDARLTYDIVTAIIKRINTRDERYKAERPESFGSLMDVFKTESRLTKALSASRRLGIKLDKDFVERAIVHESAIEAEARAEIKKSVDLNINSPKQVSNYLMNDLGLTLPKIIKRGQWTGGYSTDAKTLFSLADKHKIPMLEKIVAAKRASKKVNTYYKNFLKLVDNDGAIHCGLGQETTVTGRLSSFGPNLQNLHKEDYHDYALRNSFIAREGFKLFFMDYKQQEMAIMIDLANDAAVIAEVEAGKDIYDAMAALVLSVTSIKITRKQAKALALGVAYGQGIALIAANLGCSEGEARKLREVFTRGLRQVMALDTWAKKQAKIYGKIHNPYGRVSYIDKGFEYKALNALIQGTGADCTKLAFTNCYEHLIGHKSNVVLTVHDEIIFEISDKELFLVPELKEIMIKAYPYRRLPLKVDVEYSLTSWGKKESYVA